MAIIANEAMRHARTACHMTSVTRERGGGRLQSGGLVGGAVTAHSAGRATANAAVIISDSIQGSSLPSPLLFAASVGS